MKTATLAGLVCAFGAAAFGSHITGVTESVACATASTCGGPNSTIEITAFATQGNQMGGMTIAAVFAGNVGNGSCTWNNTTASCVGSTFSVAYPATDTTDPDSALATSVWTVTNLSSVALTSLTFNAFNGGTSFDRCLVSNAGLNGGALTFDDARDGLNNNYNNTVCNTTKTSTDFAGITTALTPNFGTTAGQFGWSAGDNGPSGSAGTALSTVTAAAVYSFLLTDAADPTPVGDEWGIMTLNFGGTAFATQNSTFTFRADTDSLVATPEPATAGLMGLALIGLGALRFRRRSRS